MSLLGVLLSFSDAQADGEQSEEIVWVDLADGLHQASAWIVNPISSIKSEVVLLLVDPKKFPLSVSDARDHRRKRKSVKDLVELSDGIAGVNANFFGTEGEPLGLVLTNGKITNPLQQGGSLLTGVFQLKNGKASIVHRDNFSPEGVRLALQSGPRLIENSKLLKFKKSNGSTRRSGIAVTARGQILLFATRYRFPGARLEDIGEVLFRTKLEITDALNFDGGGSSQLFISPKASNNQIATVDIGGGDPVPIALTVKKSAK